MKLLRPAAQSENAAAPFTLRTLSPRRGTIDQMEEDLAESRRGAESADVAPYGTDMEQLVGRGMGRQFMSKSLIFGEELTEMTPLQEELDELDESEELLAPTVHAQDRQAGKRGKRGGKPDKVDLLIDTWLAIMGLIGICGLAFLPIAFYYHRQSR